MPEGKNRNKAPQSHTARNNSKNRTTKQRCGVVALGFMTARIEPLIKIKVIIFRVDIAFKII